MAETMNLGPEWMKNSSGANHPSGSVPRTPTTPTVPNAMMSFRKFALAEFRYGKEDILALYAENLTLSSNILQSVSLITSEIVKPLAFLPFSDEEQLLFSGCVNSNNSLRLIGRGGGSLRGRGGRGRGRGRGGSDGGYYHRSYSYDEQSGGGTGDHFNRSPMDGSSSRGGFEYGRGRGGVGARSGWNNNWRDSSHNSEDERWNSGTSSRWSLSSPGSHHPGRSDSGWRNRDESKKDSLLPEWAQQDTTDGKSAQKDNNGGSVATTQSNEQMAKDKLPVADNTDTRLDKNDKNTSIKRPETVVEPQSNVVTTQQAETTTTTISPMSSFHTQETVIHKAEDKPVKSFADINKKITPLNPIPNNVQHTVRNDSAPVSKSKANGHHEEPFSPDGFTQFEKQAEDLLLTEEEETPSSSPVTLTGGSVVDSLLTGNPAAVNNTITFTNSQTRLQHPQNQMAPTVIKQQLSRPTTLPTPEQQPAIEEFYTWYYQDPDGMIQGPFTSGEMKEWFDAGYFTMDLMVRRACDSHMLPLGQVIQTWKKIPFITEGKQPPPVKITEPFWKPLMQRQPVLFQQRQQQQQQQQQMSLQTHATTTTADLTSTAESIWGRGTVQEKATPSTQWPNIESVWEQSQSRSQEDFARQEEEARRLEQEKQRQELERQKLEEEKRRKEEEAQRRLEEEIRLKQQQEMEAKALKEVKERQERERLIHLEEERRRKEEAEKERERQRQLEQERLAEWKRNEEAKKFQLQQQQEEERRLREQQLASMEAAHEQQRANHPQSIQLQHQQQQQVWSVLGLQSTTTSQPTGGASLLQIQQQEEARLKKQQMMREQQIRAQMVAAQQAQQAASAGWMTAKGMAATSPTGGKSFLEIQMEQQKVAVSNPPPVQKQSGTPWNNPATTSNHLPPRHTANTGGIWQTQPAVQQRLPRTSESDDDFWDLCMKDIPAAHRPTSLPQSRGGQTKTAATKMKKMDKQEERIRSIFATPTASDDLVDWCELQFANIQTELDAATFVNFLLQFESPHEVHDYVKLHIGDSPASKEFTRQFLERAKQCKQQQKPTTTTSGSPSSMPQVTKSKSTHQEAYPLPGSTLPSRPSGKQENGATRPNTGTATTPVGANGGGKKKKKGKMQKIDPAAILGFSVNAAERPNAGEIQSVHDAH